MHSPLKITGGARIGWVNATWPFAKLSASAQQLTVSGTLIGRYSFSPDQVVALEPYGSTPILTSGVRIVHNVQSYPDKIIFWCFGSPKRLIEKITALGFQPRAARIQAPKRGGIVFRWSFIILLIAIWNALFLLDGFVPWKEPKGPGPYALFATTLLFLTALALNFSTKFQKLALKPDRSIGEVRSLVHLTLLVSTIMLVALAAQIISS